MLRGIIYDSVSARVYPMTSLRQFPAHLETIWFGFVWVWILEGMQPLHSMDKLQQIYNNYGP